MNSTSVWRALRACVIASLGAGCAGAAAQSAAPSMQELVVTAGDFYFQSPRSALAGPTRLRVRNAGPLFHHHVQIVRIDSGHTMRELLDSLAKMKLQLPWATYVGGPEAPRPGDEMEVSLTLTPGEYVMVCFISGADHVPHVMKGMAHSLSVTASGATERTSAPQADVQIDMKEFAFEIAPAIDAGPHTLRVVNSGRALHHVALARLAPGHTAADFLTWARDQRGVPPGELIGGTTALSPGMSNTFSADFTPGDYVLVCFVPDERDGESHASHGMVRQIRVT